MAGTGSVLAASTNRQGRSPAAPVPEPGDGGRGGRMAGEPAGDDQAGAGLAATDIAAGTGAISSSLLTTCRLPWPARRRRSPAGGAQWAEAQGPIAAGRTPDVVGHLLDHTRGHASAGDSDVPATARARGPRRGHLQLAPGAVVGRGGAPSGPWGQRAAERPPPAPEPALRPAVDRPVRGGPAGRLRGHLRLLPGASPRRGRSAARGRHPRGGLPQRLDRLLPGVLR